MLIHGPVIRFFRGNNAMKCVCLLVAALTAGPLLAQNATIDYGVATEVVRTMMSDQTGQSILASTNLMANYRNFALEQELAQEAARRGLGERIDVQRIIEEARRDILIRALRNDVIRKTAEPTEKEIAEAYKKYADRLVLPATLKLDVYTIAATETQLFERAQALLTGDAAAAADQLPKRGFVHVTAQVANPWFNASQVAPAIWKRLLETPVGEAGVFPDGVNVLLIRKDDARESRPMTLDESRETVAAQVKRERQEKMWLDFVAEKGRLIGL